MLVGGLMILAGLFYSNCKAQAYTTWCEQRVKELSKQIETRSAAPASPKPVSPEPETVTEKIEVWEV